MRRKLSFLLLYGMLVLFGGLGTALLLFSEKAPRASLAENRMLAGFPALSRNAVKDGSFMSGLEDYLSDAVPERQVFVAAADSILARLSLKTAEDQAREADAALEAQVQAFAREEPTAQPTPVPTPVSTLATTPVSTLATTPGETAAATEEPIETPAPTAAPAPEKDLSDIRPCTFTMTQADGKLRTVYTFSPENIRRAIRMLNGFRAALPADGHVFFAQPPFPGLAFQLQDGTCTGWGGDLEDTINEYSDDGVYMVSVQKVLEQPLLNGEYLYYRTDHHWTPRAACYTLNAILAAHGVDPKPYDSYAFRPSRSFYGSAALSNPNIRSTTKPDTLEVPLPDAPVKGYRIFWNGHETDAPLLYDYANYMAFLGGTQGPWRRFETGVDCGRSCLVIGDSFSNCFIPFLMPYYETVHVTDVRADYYDRFNVSWTLSEFIREKDVDDVYLVFSTANGVNTVYIMESLLGYL